MNKKRLFIGIMLLFVLLAVIALYSIFDPDKYSFFPKCIFHSITGYKCPGCGSQRAIYNLIHGHFRTAFLYNPLMFILLPYVFLGIYIEYIADKSKNKVRNIRGKLYNMRVFMLLVVIIIIYAIVRNIWNF